MCEWRGGIVGIYVGWCRWEFCILYGECRVECHVIAHRTIDYNITSTSFLDVHEWGGRKYVELLCFVRRITPEYAVIRLASADIIIEILSSIFIRMSY